MPELARRSGLFAHLPLAACLTGLVAHAAWYDFTSDDAFIIARYARNVALGRGWVWNVGEQVEGYTSFLWVALAAAAGKLGLDCAAAVRGLSLAAALGCLVTLVRIAPVLGLPARGPARWLAPALLASNSSFACWALGGLETCGYALLVLLATWTTLSASRSPARAASAGALAGLCALTRPEGLLVALVLGCWLAWDLRSDRIARLGAYAVPAASIIGAHLLWRRSTYGDWLPNTYYAKVGSGPAVWAEGVLYVLDSVADNGGLLVWTVPLAAAWLPGRPRALRALSLVALTLIASVVLVGGDGLAMHRFLVPLMPLWLLLVVWAMGEVADMARRALPGLPRWSRRALAGVAIAALAGSLATKPVLSWQYNLYLEQRDEVPDWIAVGRWLRQNAPPGASVACVPIGAVGYHSGLPVFDMLGLTDRHIAHREMSLGQGWPGHEKHDGPYILSRQPTYLLLGNIRVLDAPLAPGNPYFVRPLNQGIQQREGDIFIPELFASYEPQVAQLDNGRYLHFLKRK